MQAVIIRHWELMSSQAGQKTRALFSALLLGSYSTLDVGLLQISSLQFVFVIAEFPQLVPTGYRLCRIVSRA